MTVHPQGAPLSPPQEAFLSDIASMCHCRHAAEYDRPHFDWLLNTKWLQCTACWSSDYGPGRHHMSPGTVPHQQPVPGQERPHILPVRGRLHWLWNHFLYLVRDHSVAWPNHVSASSVSYMTPLYVATVIHCEIISYISRSKKHVSD